MKDLFRYEWELVRFIVVDLTITKVLTYSRNEVELQDIFLDIVDLSFNNAMQTPEDIKRKEEVKNILLRYSNESVIASSMYISFR